jgi:adenylyltransferase/sulfurtransferase
MSSDHVTVQDLREALNNPSSGIKALDVREPDEQKIAAIPGVPLLPLSQLPQRFKELDPNQTYYIHCKAGGRSARAVAFLRDQGFKNVKNVAGGIAAWSEQIDPSVPKY